MKNKFVKKLLAGAMSAAMMLSAAPMSIALASTDENGTEVTSRKDVLVDIRIGLFGDTHITHNPVWTTAEAGIGALMETYKTIDPNMDAFAMPGDVIFNVAPESELCEDKEKYQAVVDKIKEDFPNLDYSVDAQTDTANKTKAIWAMGNHEVTLGAYQNSVTTFKNNRTWQEEVADNVSQYTEFFGHSPLYKTCVNGYWFVTAQPYDYLNNYVDPADKTKMSEHEKQVKEYLTDALNADSEKPVFYLQHEAVDKTLLASDTNSPVRNSEEFRQFILDNPRIVTLSGHYHAPANDPRLIWQLSNGSTHINIPASSGSTHKYGTVDESSDSESASQALLLEAKGKEVTLRRFDIKTKKYIGEPIVFTPGTADSKYTDTRLTTASESVTNKAVFPDGAQITASNITNNKATVSFPAATKPGESAKGLQDSFVHFYQVDVKNKKTDSIVKTLKLMDDFWRTDATKRTTRSIALDSLSRNTEYEVTVTPQSSLGQNGNVLTGTFTTTNEKTAEDLALTARTDLMNVAKGKTATSTLSLSNISNLTDGNHNTFISGTYSAGGYISLDLGRRYNIEKIVVNSYQEQSQGERGFVLEVSNDPDFAEDNTKILYTGKDNINTNTDFDANNNLTLKYSGSEDYRYIRYRRTNGWYIYLGEIEVYAREYVTEVSRNKSAEANITAYSSNPTTKAVNGISDGGWWSAYPGASSGKYNAFGTDEILDYLIVDLEEALPVDKIEIEYPKDISDNSASRQGWSVYGSNSLPDTATSTGTNSVVYRPQMVNATMPEMFTELCTTGTNYYIPKYGTTPLKMGGNVYNDEGYVSQSVNSEKTKYRFITFKKLNKNIAQVGEVRAFVTNPTFNSVKKTTGGYQISFSDSMDKSTLTGDNIKLYNASGTEISGAQFTVSDAGDQVDITNASDVSKVSVNYNVKSANGVEIAGPLTRYFMRDVDFSDKPVITESNINVAESKNVTVSGITEESYSGGAQSVADAKQTSILYGTFAANSTVTVDLGRRYNLKEVKITVPSGGNQTAQQYEVQASNDVNFKTYDVLHKVGGLTEITELADDIKLDGTKDYRYVRYVKLTGAWGGITEIEVYADEALMEISRNAETTANTTWSGYSTSAAVDGKNGANADGWQSYYSGSEETSEKYMWLSVNLGAQYPIRKIEMESLFDGIGNGDQWSRRGWAIYGSNTAPTNESIRDGVAYDPSGLYYININGFDQLAKTTFFIPSFNSGENNSQKYKLSECDRNEDFYGYVSEWVSGEYQYITFQRGSISLTGLGEVRVYTAAPQANNVRLDGNKVTVSFSESMFPDNINGETVVLKDSAGNVVNYEDSFVDDCEYSFNADLVDGVTYTLEISSDIKNLNSLPVAAKTFTFTVPTPIVASNVVVKDADDTAVVTDFAVNTSYNLHMDLLSKMSSNVNAFVIIAQKDADGNLIAVDTANPTVNGNTATEDVKVKFNVLNEVPDTIEVYIWNSDATQPYSHVVNAK